MKLMLLVFTFFAQAALAFPVQTFINPQGMKLSYQSFVSSKNHKSIVILPGRSEPALKYAELITELRKLRFNIFILDHQGQGLSERLLTDSQKGHVRHFKDYVDDFALWMEEVVIPQTVNQKRFLLAHSMGGAIGALYLSEGPQVFEKAVLSAPMFELNTKPYTEKVARLLSGALVLAGRGARYAPDRGPYVAADDTFDKNELTHSLKRFTFSKALFVSMPRLVVGGPTNRWVHESLVATKKIDLLAPKIKTPILMLQAGEDLIVKLPRQDSFCRRSPVCRKVHYPTAYHEILQETDDIRDAAISEIKKFLKD